MDKGSLAFDLLPQAWKSGVPLELLRSAEELRLRVGRDPTLLRGGQEKPLCSNLVRENDLIRILEKATGASLHAAVSSMKEGYVNYRGIRIGICGAALMQAGELSVFHRFTSLAVRIPREARGICGGEIEDMLKRGFQNTLILGPPGSGKTTALREIIRRLSDAGIRVCAADERNELAALDAEGPAFDLGRCTDYLTGVPKTAAAMMLLRGMNPQILAMDEISREGDLEVLDQIAGCGVGILASVHGESVQDLKKRDAYRRRIDSHVFNQALIVAVENGKRTYRLEEISL